MKSVRELKRELPLLYKRGKVEPRDITYLFGKVREILENKREYKVKYPELNLFCNWCAHTKLSKSKTIYRALLEVSTSLSKATNVIEGSDPSDMTNAFCKDSGNILNIPKLRLGLKAVLEDQKIDATIASEKKWWDSCIQLLLHEISEKPLEFPPKVLDGSDTKHYSYNFYKKILELPNALDNDKVVCLKVMLEESSPLFEGSNGYTLHFTTVSGVHMVVAIQGKEHESVYTS